MEEENPSPGQKNLSPDHPLEISTRQDSCSTLGHYVPSKPKSLHVLEFSKLPLATDFSKSFLFLAY